MEEVSEASRLRLSSARRRIDTFIEQIEVLAASSFPHEDGRKALAAIRADCKELQADLSVPSGIRSDVVNQLCLTLSDKVDNLSAILGFILRSTNVRNPFELHFAVKCLIVRALGEMLQGQKISLLISSEWSYIPFTYPMNVDQLPSSILIGTPAPESGNPLLIPLAGHEIGHSAWRVYAFWPRFMTQVQDEVEQELLYNQTARKALQDADPLGPLGHARIVDQCADNVMEQLEEVFCDLFGLYLFGSAFVSAFDYLLGPGGHDRCLDYPSDRQRMQFLVAASGELAIELDPAMIVDWTHAPPPKSEVAAAEIVDAVVEKLVPAIRTELFRELKEREIAIPRQDVIADIRDAFARGEPYPERMELGEIVSAGWLRLRELDAADCSGETEEDRHRERIKSYKVLYDLVLKTVEIAEYYDRISADA